MLVVQISYGAEETYVHFDKPKTARTFNQVATPRATHKLANIPLDQASSFTAAYRQLANARKANVLAEQYLERREIDFEQFKINDEQIPISKNELPDAEFDVLSARANLGDMMLRLAEAKRLVELSQNRISSLQEQIHALKLVARISEYNANRVSQLQKQVDFENAMLDLASTRVNILTTSVQIAQQQLKLEEQFYQLIQTRFLAQKNQIAHNQLEQTILSLQRQQEYWLRTLAIAQEQLSLQVQYNLRHNHKTLSSKSLMSINKFQQNKEALEFKIFEANERSDLLDQEMALTKMHYDQKAINQKLTATASVNELNTQVKQLQYLQNEANSTLQLLYQKQAFLKKRLDLVPAGTSGEHDTKILTDLLHLTQTQQNKMWNIIKSIRLEKKYANELIKQSIAKKQQLPGLNLNEWQQLGSELTLIPTFIWLAMVGFVENLVSHAKNFTIWLWLDILIVSALGFATAQWSRNYLNNLLKSGHYRIVPKRLLRNIQTILLKYVNRNILPLIFFITIILLLVVSSFTLLTLKPLLLLAAVWLLFSFLIHLARIWLVESTTDQQGQDVKLYIRLKWLLISSGIFTAILITIDQLPLAYTVHDLFHRIFMFIVLIFAIIFLIF